MEIHTREGSSFQRAMGGSCQIHERVVGETKLMFEEAATILTQVEGIMNSRPLTSLPSNDDGIEALTPGHFLIGKAIESLPGCSPPAHNLTLLSSTMGALPEPSSPLLATLVN